MTDMDLLLRTYLAGRDVPCPMSAYNLRDLTSARRPQCGEVVELHVGLAEPKMGAWITGLVGLSAGLGFSVILLSLLVCFGASGRELIDEFWPLWGGIMIQGPLLAAWIREASWMRWCPAPGRRIAAVECWASAAFVAALFAYVLT
ncbi:MAG: hypothetical protein ACE5I3_14150 [Phycisphaerae bacterium]